MTGGRGVDCAVEASGLPVTMIQTIETAAVFGQVMLLGDHHHDVPLSGPLISSMLRRELTVYGTWNSKITPAGKSEWDMVLSHMRRDFQVGPLISHTPALTKAPGVRRHGFQAYLDQQSDLCRLGGSQGGSRPGIRRLNFIWTANPSGV